MRSFFDRDHLPLALPNAGVVNANMIQSLVDTLSLLYIDTWCRRPLFLPVIIIPLSSLAVPADFPSVEGYGQWTTNEQYDVLF